MKTQKQKECTTPTHLVVNGLVKVLDEDVSLTGLSEDRISLGPHDSASSSLDEGVVEGIKGSLSVSSIEVVDVGVSQGSSGDGVPADSDGSHGPDHVEDLEEHGLGDGGVELSDVKRGRRGGVGGGVGSSDHSGLGVSRSGGGKRNGGGSGRGGGRSLGGGNGRDLGG